MVGESLYVRGTNIKDGISRNPIYQGRSAMVLIPILGMILILALIIFLAWWQANRK